MTTPYIGFSIDDLRDRQTVHAGDTFLCDKCNKLHELEAGKDEKGNPAGILLFYMCEETPYLGAVDNKLIINVEATVSGQIDLSEKGNSRVDSVT